MRLSHTLLMAGVAILTLPSCSSAQGPGEIGTTDDIVVRNRGDAPPPPDTAALSAAAQGETEVLLNEEAAASPEMMATKSQVEASAEAVSEAPDAVARTGDEAQAAMTAPAPAVQSPAQVQNPVAATQNVDTSGMEAVPPPVMDEDMAERPEPASDPMGRTIDDVSAPPVEQAAEEYQDKGAQQAAAEAMQNQPDDTVTTYEPRPPAAPVRPQAPVQPAGVQTNANASANVAYDNSAGTFRPSEADIARGGMRVVVAPDGEIRPDAQSMTPAVAAPAPAPVPSPASPAAPSAPAVQEQAPVPTPAAPAPGGAPVMDQVLIQKAQTILTQQGYYTGPVDGEMSTAMMNALSRYQAVNHLTPGAMTVETAKHMGLIQ